MAKSRIVLTAIGSLGDLHPKIAIALELRKRGHRAAFATHIECASPNNAIKLSQNIKALSE
jgi:UDP:flavonoid glycosyltransferase YjiC (YdhE family)